VILNCKICNTEFSPRGRSLTCSKECSLINRQNSKDEATIKARLNGTAKENHKRAYEKKKAMILAEKGPRILKDERIRNVSSLMMCENCGNLFIYKTKLLRNVPAHFYCSTDCKNKSIKKPDPSIHNKVKAQCDGCGVVYRKRRKDLNELNFCTTQCRQDYWEERDRLLGLNNVKEVCCNSCGKHIFRDIRNKYFFCSQECHSKIKQGSGSNFWKGGITKFTNSLRSSRQMIEWRQSVLSLNGSVCKSCGSTEEIEVHHIKELYKILVSNNIKTRKEAINCPEIWNVLNGMVLCHSCHANVHGYDWSNWVHKKQVA
jgi:hypothetical protein